MLRITTNGTLKSYKSNLMRSTNNLNLAREKVLTQRNFTRYAEDPAAATQAFKLRRAFSRTSDQLSNTTMLVKQYESAWSSLNAVKSLADEMGKKVAIEGSTSSQGGGRQPLGEVLSGAAKSIVQSMNAKYGDSFLFSGSDGLKVPFTWGSNGEILYRGIDVSSGSPAGLPAGDPPDPGSVNAGTPWGDYYANNPDFATLVSLSKESNYIDIGAGMVENKDGDLISSSAFDSSLPGIDILGFGVDADGDPKNIAALMMKLSGIYAKCDPETGAYNPSTDEAEALRLMDKFNGAISNLTNKWTALDTQSKYLNQTEDRLTDNANTINEQFLSIEDCDLGDAITNFSWAQYCYNAALKVGNSILSQSLIDYMN